MNNIQLKVSHSTSSFTLSADELYTKAIQEGNTELFEEAKKSGLSPEKITKGSYLLGTQLLKKGEIEKAEKYLTTAKEGKHPQALLYFARKNQKTNKKESLKLLKILDQLHLKSEFVPLQTEGKKLRAQIHVDSDELEQAQHLIEGLGKEGNEDLFKLAQHCLSKKDKLQKGIEILKKLGNQGHTDAQCSLGLLYFNGREGLPKSFENAEPWLKKAASLNKIAKEVLLEQYAKEKEWDKYVEILNRYSPPENFESSVFAFIEKKDFGSFCTKANYTLETHKTRIGELEGRISYNLGRAYLRADHKTLYQTRYKQAVQCWKTGADKGHAGCCFLLGLAYAGGNGVKKDSKKAEQYWEQAKKDPTFAAKIESLNKREIVVKKSDTTKVSELENLKNLPLRDQEVEDYLASKKPWTKRVKHAINRNSAAYTKIACTALAVILFIGLCFLVQTPVFLMAAADFGMGWGIAAWILVSLFTAGVLAVTFMPELRESPVTYTPAYRKSVLGF